MNFCLIKIFLMGYHQTHFVHAKFLVGHFHGAFVKLHFQLMYLQVQTCLKYSSLGVAYVLPGKIRRVSSHY